MPLSLRPWRARRQESVSMSILVTGSAGHLGEGLMRRLRAQSREAVGIDIKASAYT